MIARIVCIWLIAALVASPSFAGCCDLKGAAQAAAAVAMTEQDKASDPDEGIVCSHHCCLAHAHYGDRAPATSVALPRLAPGTRVSVISEDFPQGPVPSPLLEPPSKA